MNLVQLLGSNLRSLRSRDLAPVEVAVLDTGIDATHPDLKDRVVGAYRIVRARGGYEAVPQAVPASNDAFGHGTGVASIIASVAPNARLVDIQVVGSGEVGTGEALMAGFRLALGLRARILNLSLACHRRFLLPLVELCEEAYWKDQMVVAARRNLPLLDEGIPAELSSCIGVDAGAFTSSLALGFRARSPIEYVARGEQIVVAAPGAKYTVQTGSSYASATLAGICALVLGGCPDLSPFEVKAALKAMAEGPTP